jgi:glycerol-3-phosphate dehydrogenase
VVKKSSAASSKNATVNNKMSVVCTRRFVISRSTTCFIASGSGRRFSARRFASSDRGQQQQHHRQQTRSYRDGPSWTTTASSILSTDHDTASSKQVPGPQGIPSRAGQVQELQTSTTTFDLLVIGGGATGAGVALDAASRGYSVACIERGDFASETSSRSTKLIWAGLKYMGTATAAFLSPNLLFQPVATVKEFMGEMKMVLHCHRERRYMTETQRHLTNWIPIVVPFNSWHVSNPPPMDHALFGFFPILAPFTFKFYDMLSSFSCPPSYSMSKRQVKKVFPQLKADNLKYASVFYEAQHNDARTNLAIAMTAAEKGAKIANYIEAVDLIKADDRKVIGAKCLDRISGKTFDVKANKVVLAGGPFTDSLRQMESEKDQGQAVRGGSGTHIVLAGHFLPKDFGLLDFRTSDGRFMFMLPWQGHTLIGTTDKTCPAETLHNPPEDEVEWLLNEAQKHLSLPVTRSDVLSAWRGWRPLAADPNLPPGAPVSRDHVISENPESGVVFVSGGKWTTFRQMAEEVTDQCFPNGPKSQTLEIKLHGGEGYSENIASDLVQKYGLVDKVAQHLARTYGGRSFEVCELGAGRGASFGHKLLVDGFPYIEAEIIFACREYACTVEDILSRRTRLAYLNKGAALEAIPKVADCLASELGWSERVKNERIVAAEIYVGSYGGNVAGDLTTSLVANATTSASPEKVFTALDADADGIIDERDVEEAAALLGLMSEEDVKAAFAQMDQDGSGRVTVSSFSKWWHENSPLQKQLMHELQ